VSPERPRSRRRVNQQNQQAGDAPDTAPDPGLTVLLASSSRSEAVRERRDRLREMLRDPESLRRAFLVHEILSAPVSLRQMGADRPG
jgi:hypothetical protein